MRSRIKVDRLAPAKVSLEALERLLGALDGILAVGRRPSVDDLLDVRLAVMETVFLLKMAYGDL
jgi:hypothetical protein